MTWDKTYTLPVMRLLDDSKFPHLRHKQVKGESRSGKL